MITYIPAHEFNYIVLFICTSLVVKALIYSPQPTNAFYERPGVSSKELLQARGYLAEEHFFTSPDGYRILLTRGRNPLIERGARGLAHRDPIIFSHGILEDSAVFLINSFDVKQPRDLSARNVSNPAEALKITSEPSARSLPFLAMDQGHEVWMFNRRGYPGSQEKLGNDRSLKPRGRRRKRRDTNDDLEQFERLSEDDYDYYSHLNDCPVCDEHLDYEPQNDCHQDDHQTGDKRDQDKKESEQNEEDQEEEAPVGASRFSLDPILALPGALTNYGRLRETFLFSFNRDFWKFSFDEQAKFDFPMAIDYVLKATNRSKVATVTHSAAGSILLMMLASQPDYSKKLANNVLWAPGFRLGLKDSFTNLVRAKRFFESYGRSVPPAFTSNKLQGILGVVCNLPLAPRTVCSFFSDFLTGDSGGKEPIRPEFLSTVLYPTSSFELAQNLQNVASGNIMHFFDYGPSENRRVYNGQERPPAYDLGKIKAPVSLNLVTSQTDRIVSKEDVLGVKPLLKVPANFHVIETKFSHQGYFFHDDTAELAIVPALIELQKKH